MEVLEEIVPLIPIGSQLWGGSTELSDWDYVTVKENIKAVRNLIENTVTDEDSVRWSTYNDNALMNVESVKFKVGADTINILFYDKEYIPVIERLNKFMDKVNKDGLAVRKARHYLMEGFLKDVNNEVGLF